MIRVILLLVLLGFNVRFTAEAAFFDNWNREAYVWRQSALTNGGAVSDRAYTAATRLVNNLYSSGVRQHIVRAGAYLGGVAGGTDAQKTNAWVVPLIKNFPGGADKGHALDFMVAFAAADFDEAVGATGDGSTKHLRTNLPSSDQGNVSSLHHAVYCRTNKTEAGGSIGGAAGGAGTFVNYFLFGWVDSNCYAYYDDTAAQVSAADVSPFTGFYLATRLGTASRKIYRRGVAILTSTTDVGVTPALAAGDQYIHGLAVGGTLNSPTTRTLAWYSFGDGLTDALVTSYNNDIQRFQYDMGRAIP